jgi:hypothetical protein
MKGTLKYITLFALIGMLGCSEDPEGPLLSDLYGEFNLIAGLEVSSDAVDFCSGESVFFTAEFSKSTDWELRIQGLSSGSEKIISGKSRRLDATNTSWNGSTTDFPLFRAEQAEITLYVPEDTLYMKDTVSIDVPKCDEGFVLLDFESGENPLWDEFVQSGGQMTFNVDDVDTAAQGQYYYDMAGEVNWDWLIGYLYVPAASFSDSVLQGGNTLPLSGDPNNVYINFLLNSPVGINNELLLIRINEDEDLDGTFNGANEDQYSIEIRNVDPGWNLYSFKYSELAALFNGQPTSAAGNDLHEPDKIHQVEFLFLADPSSGYSRLLMDYVVFTEGGPLDP